MSDARTGVSETAAVCERDLNKPMLYGCVCVCGRVTV